MNKFEKDVLNLIRSVLKDETPVCSELDYKRLYAFSVSQQIVCLLFLALSKIPSFKGSEVYPDFYKSYVLALTTSENQKYELNNLFTAFKENGISFVPLKGTLLKELYPLPEMRAMADADVLIKVSELNKVDKIMKDAGFNFTHESDHEYAWEKGDFVSIELHKRLIPSYNKDFFAYYKDGWQLVEDGKLSTEDNFIFLFTHFAKHYRDSGVGIKYLIDLYLYINRYKEMNFKYVEGELEKLKLLEFYKNVITLLNVWFNGEKENDKTDFITDYVFSNGVYGNYKNGRASEALKLSKEGGNTKLKRIFSWAFPSYGLMKTQYRVLIKLPILLPFCYVYRWIKLLFTRNVIKESKERLKYYDAKKIEEHKKSLNYVGLDYNFGEEKDG